ncbi:hypothetical protein JOB18_004590 [Solea senegalensis]|uniref:Uncharacterized protein n=1 Tax=Solea senegalensis TaxID=28829 RepID=A0AAV6R4N1_SOLSE|nr:hypothetical protein JOB18_004590 [Solea senegalensis]
MDITEVKLKMNETKQFMDESSAWGYPRDDFDRVCKIIWSRAQHVEEKFGTSLCAPESPQNEDGASSLGTLSHWEMEQHMEAEDLRQNPEFVGTGMMEVNITPHMVKEEAGRHLVNIYHPLANLAAHLHPLKVPGLREKCDIPRTNVENGQRHIYPTHHCNVTLDYNQRCVENVPHEVTSIWTKDQIAALDHQTLCSSKQNEISITKHEELETYNQPHPEVTHNVDLNARTWASVVKEGIKRAPTPQHEARHRTFQQRHAIIRANVAGTHGVDISGRTWASTKEGTKRAAVPQQGPRLRTFQQTGAIRAKVEGVDVNPRTQINAVKEGKKKAAAPRWAKRR